MGGPPGSEDSAEAQGGARQSATDSTEAQVRCRAQCYPGGKGHHSRVFFNQESNLTRLTLQKDNTICGVENA